MWQGGHHNPSEQYEETEISYPYYASNRDSSVIQLTGFTLFTGHEGP
jgi:hypothetical protein